MRTAFPCVIAMTDLGLLFHGYDEESATTIGQTFSDELKRLIHIFGATGKGETTVQGILDSSMKGFGDDEPKVMMLLGFEQDQIGVALKHFPDAIPRPIFCGLTEENLTWKISHLTEHLLEEQTYWKEEARKKREQKELEEMKREQREQDVSGESRPGDTEPISDEETETITGSDPVTDDETGSPEPIEPFNDSQSEASPGE
jgi:hypothetical protein